ncbi:gamma-glutamyl-gamma-aminobutyrate hydrolase family protein [Angustibacter luteus]|uniref:Gamma-glutamyl-gamma-aminobutyrate hydrolase family protein n=1 Tax=Angustibacter luteus TaxID=658456 RepID=A0ABW1JEL5_9ACTN
MTERTGGRPLVVIPARYSQSASALRYRAEVVARTLAEAVFEAGGEPLVTHPHAPGATVDVDAARERLRFADALLLPGGGDVSARWTATDDHPSLYDVDEGQDAWDIALAQAAMADGLPLLSICRGTQIVNVALGGTLVADMAETVGDHRHRTHQIKVAVDSPLAAVVGEQPTISCYHHQCLDQLAPGLRAVAWAGDGVIEAVASDVLTGWYVGVQWHPEDSAATDPAQAAIFAGLVRAAAGRRDAAPHGRGER